MDNSGGKSYGFPVVASDGAKLGFYESSILGDADYFKVNIPCLELMKEVVNTIHLELMNQNMKESRRDLYLDLRITLLTVIYYKLQRDLLTSFLMA